MLEHLNPTPQKPSRVVVLGAYGFVGGTCARLLTARGVQLLPLDKDDIDLMASGAAEQLLATSETDAVNRHITELLVPADTEAQGAANLAAAVTWAARGDEKMRKVVVRPANTFGVRLTARIAGCGPPRAALIVFE